MARKNAPPTLAEAAKKLAKKSLKAATTAPNATAAVAAEAAPKGTKNTKGTNAQSGSKQRQKPAVPPSAPSKELHVFPNPAPERDYLIRFDVPEFTCLCPLTGQPDFAHFTIEIIADQLNIELKSLKMYFWSFRNEGAFHEKVTNTILEDIVQATQPRFVRVHADWFVRGGIRTFVTAEHRKKGWKPLPKIDLPGA